MADRNESSAFYSLTHLMDLERERVAQETALEERRAREHREQREREAEAAREVEARRAREAEENRKVAEQRQREESARLEAIREGELERAKADAEQHARAEAEALQRIHGAALVEIQKEPSGGALRIAVIALLGTGLIALGFQWRQDQGRAARERAAVSAQRQHLNEESARIVQEIEHLRQRVTETTAQTATSEAELSAVKSQAERQTLVDEQRQKERHPETAGKDNADKSHRPPPPAKRCDCTPGDPLCSCL